MAKKKFDHANDPKFHEVRGTLNALAVGIRAVYPDGQIPEASRVLEHGEYIYRPVGGDKVYAYHHGTTVESDGNVQSIVFRLWDAWDEKSKMQISFRRTVRGAPYIEAARATEQGVIITFDRPPSAWTRYVNLDLHTRRKQFIPVAFRVDARSRMRYYVVGFEFNRVPMIVVRTVQSDQVPEWLAKRARRA